MPNNLHVEDYLTDAQEQAIERWLEEVTKHLERMGFRPPRYEKLNADGDAFEVQVFPFDGTARALNDCDNPALETVIHLNPLSADTFKDGELTAQGYQDLAHELFHVVQYAYSDMCNWGNWVTEGTAQAVGIETARSLRDVGPTSVCQIGLRLYSKPLYTDDTSRFGDFPCRGHPGRLNYAAQSFWQFLGEKRARRNAGQMAAPPQQFFPPDYRYLHNFFNTPHPRSSSAASYDWLQKALSRAVRRGKHQFGISVHTAYAEFVGGYSTYWREDRLSLYPRTSNEAPAERAEKWMQWVFGGCEDVALSKNASTSVSLRIAQVAARCVKLTFPDAPAAERINLAVYATGQNLDVDALAVATAGADNLKILRRFGAGPAGLLGVLSEIWAKTGSPRYLIVSNVRRDNPGNTIPMEVTLSITPEVTSTTMAKTKSKAVPEDATREEKVEAAVASTSWQGRADQKDRAPCTNRPFEARPCGAVTKIELRLASDATKLLREAGQPTLFMRPGADKGILGAMQEGPEQMMDAFGKTAKQIKQQDGHSIRITLPRIAPGYTGTIGNAHMRVARARAADAGAAPDDYEAVGPGWVDTGTGYGGRCIGGYLPASGTVTVKEFTKNSLIGTFSADLVDPEANLECGEPARIAKSISGSFSISDIDFNDTQDQSETSREQALDQAIESTNAALPGLITDDARARLKQKIREGSEPGESGRAGGGGGSSVMQRCQCSCQLQAGVCAAESEAECCRACQPIFDLCQGNPRGLSQGLSDQERGRKIQAMRQRWAAYVDSLGLKGTAKAQMLESFDRVKTIEQKRIMMLSVPDQ